MFSETIAVRYAYLFDQPLDVLIQGIQLSLHHKNDGDQLFPAAVIQFFQCMSAIVQLLKLFLLYQKTQRIANRQPPQVSSFCLCLYGGVMVIEPGKYKVFKVLKFYPDSPVDTSQTMKQRPKRL